MAGAHVFIATSLDGFIARRDGDIDWLPSETGDAESDDHGYHAFVASVDALVMGRNTFDKVLSFGVWPYEGKPVFVLTSRPLALPESLAGRAEAIAGDPAHVMATLAARGIHDVYVDGGETIQRFLESGQVRRLIITRVPVLLGDGIPLFGPVSRDVRLTHVRTTSYPSGLVQSEYAVNP